MSEIKLTADQDDEIIQITKAISSKTRFRILQLLSRDEMDITRISETLEQTEANVSAQVKKLEEANLVESRYEPGDHGVRKICKTVAKKVIIEIMQD